jgi:DNA polymerase-1
MSETILLVDGSSYLYRAFHAMPKLMNTRGEPTGATYGIVNMLRRLIIDFNPDYCCVVFDAPGPTFRNSLYSEYKANRPPMPEELRNQIPQINSLINALGLCIMSVKGVEADDVIGTLATKAATSNMEVFIISGDKDLTQLVTKNITMIDTMKDITYDHDEVIKKFGVSPNQIVDYLSLVGDTSDNVPGVPKVGPKTACKLLQEYSSIEHIIKYLNDIPGKVGSNLKDSLDQLTLVRQLVTIKCDVPLKLTPKDLKPNQPNLEELRKLYFHLEFNTWLVELSEETKSTNEHAEKPPEYDVILNNEMLETWIKRLEAAPYFSFDSETTSLNIMQAELVGISFSDQMGRAAYVPFAHDYVGAPKQLKLDLVLERLRPLLENDHVIKIGQNLKYDRSILLNYGINLRGIRFDTMLESYILNSTGSRHDMDTLALTHLNHTTIKFEDVAGKGKSQVTFSQVQLENAGAYAAEDAEITLRLHEHLMPKLQLKPDLLKLFTAIEMPLVPVLSNIERTGVRVNTEMLGVQSRELSERILDIEERAYEIAKSRFNIASPKQIQTVLFDKLNLPVISKTPKGQPSTAEGVLQELAEEHELPRLILEHRGFSKLRSTYTDKLPQLVDTKTGRVHTSYHQAAVGTGRLSSTDPNLQNIPIRTLEGRRIREAFEPEEGKTFLSADYSQIELRIMAHLSGDEGLINAFNAEKDIHSATASEVFDCPLDQVTQDQRRSAKSINFGLIYGMSSFGLSKQLGIDLKEAQQYIDLYFERYPGVRIFMTQTRELAREQKYVETLLGRRLYLNEINASNHNRRQAAERAAINAPMQGTAADIIKLSMLAIDSWISDEALGTRMILQVHDELVFEIPDNEINKVSKSVPKLMCGVIKLLVPLRVDVGVGQNWADAHS